MFEWDDKKAQANLAKHGIAFEAAARLDWYDTVDIVDERFDYGELRYVSVGWLDGKLHSVTYTLRGGNIRIVSLRKSDKRDRRVYEREKA